ncbi:MAG: hypothetical protein ONB14_06710 [candidate division KSB1 bacterium]|nr:hypothetical protein [candidate division KSB1 bacterium]MDZ7413959.1 hypothetical protein [candidate division KSB1 bacterium]
MVEDLTGVVHKDATWRREDRGVRILASDCHVRSMFLAGGQKYTRGFVIVDGGLLTGTC